MDECKIKQYSQAEVDLSYYKWRPAWKSLFHYEIREKFTELEQALEYYSIASEDVINRRIGILYWEEAAWLCFDQLQLEIKHLFQHSISPQKLAKREIESVEKLLETGVYQLVLEKDPQLLINEIPSLYEKLLIGKYDDFISLCETEAYEMAYEHERTTYYQSLSELFSNADENKSEGLEKADEEFKNNLPLYIDYFTQNWVVSMQIQSFLWYRKYLMNIDLDSDFSFSYRPIDWVPIKENQQQTKLTVLPVKRLNDGRIAILASYEKFEADYGRSPRWQELMTYMGETPIKGILIIPKYRGKQVSELEIEGVEKPIDRDAFRNRYNRYFKKSG